LTASFDSVIKNRDCPPNPAGPDNFNWATFEPMPDNDFEIQFFTNEYFVNNAFWAIFYADMLNFTAPIPDTGTISLTTTDINFGLFGALKKHGFDDGMPC